MATIQVKNFQKAARRAGLRREDYRARSPKNRHGEYGPLEVTIFARTSEQQVRALGEDYCVTVFQRGGRVRWDQPLVEGSGRAGVRLVNLDERDEYGLHPERVI